MDNKTKAYWATTGLFCLVLGFSGFSHLTHASFIEEGMEGLGIPIYVSTILGVWKLLGVVALLAPGSPLLKEWAYAGFTFNLLGASASHAFAGDPAGEVVAPLLILGLAVASYLLRPATRRLEAAPSLGESTLIPRPSEAASHG